MWVMEEEVMWKVEVVMVCSEQTSSDKFWKFIDEFDWSVAMKIILSNVSVSDTGIHGW